MRKARTVIGILVMAVLGLCAVSALAAQGDFSGTWILDKKKTRSLPTGVENYTMVVKQTDAQLVVDNHLGGEVVAKANDTHLGGGGVMEGLGGGGGGYKAGTLALSSTNPHVEYSLDGEETTGPAVIPNFKLKLKAKLGKDGRSLELSQVQQEANGSRGVSVSATLKERWTLSGDGRVLKVQRTVANGAGTDTIVLIFEKGQDNPAAPQP